ncbi:hypothetical protein ERX37_07995 [Macrococcus hajekii]|uniref:Uncharacterized protein n=1 Tax=Macrococcus hajekii TaxID=198482 RepID=A0A4V3BDU2_9STAP|nr:hypothetical protein [Macrococcus hajekii]TDM01434.1 hypothetical protein ERX37_07995 [Macrococcus hajekii]GGA99946.1 hypothetical protein GCM10007190_04990 [Macrococcus hajekii]
MKDTAQFLVVLIASGAISLSITLSLAYISIIEQGNGPGLILILTLCLFAAIGHLTKEAWGWFA